MSTEALSSLYAITPGRGAPRSSRLAERADSPARRRQAAGYADRRLDHERHRVRCRARADHRREPRWPRSESPWSPARKTSTSTRWARQCSWCAQAFSSSLVTAGGRSSSSTNTQRGDARCERLGCQRLLAPRSGMLAPDRNGPRRKAGTTRWTDLTGSPNRPAGIFASSSSGCGIVEVRGGHPRSEVAGAHGDHTQAFAAPLQGQGLRQ